MRRILSVAILAATVCGHAGAARADDGGQARQPSDPAASLDDIRGQYVLADGRVLTITGSGRKIRAQLDGRPDSVLVPAGGAVFDARDGAFRLIFEQHASGNVTGVQLEESRERTAAARPVAATGTR